MYAISLIIVCTIAAQHIVKAEMFYTGVRYMLAGQSVLVVISAINAFFRARKNISSFSTIPPSAAFMMFHLFVLGACASLVPGKTDGTVVPH